MLNNFYNFKIYIVNIIKILDNKNNFNKNNSNKNNPNENNINKGHNVVYHLTGHITSPYIFSRITTHYFSFIII